MRFDGFFGNEALQQRLSASFAAGKVSHCYLIAGPVGSGKRTLATILAAAMQCTGGGDVPCRACTACRKVFSGNHPDVITVDEPEKKTVSVDLVREARADAFIRPNEGRRKIYILPRAQDFGPAAQNALLKLLEEPPQYAAFLLLATNPGALLPTIRSRAVQLSLCAVPREAAIQALRAKFPDRDEATLRAAYDASGGFLGQAAEHLTGSVWREETAQFAACYASGDRLGLLRVLLPLEKAKRPELTAILLEWRRLLTQALAASSGAAAVSPEAAQLCAKRTGAQLLAAAECVQRGMELLGANVNTGALVSWLSAKLR